MTGMTEVTRNAASSATALNRIQSRFNQILDESSSVGKKLTDWYTSHGIDVYDKQTGQLRSMYDVLDDLSKIWNTLDPDEIGYYKLIQGGAAQGSRLSSLLGNFAKAREAAEVAAKESSGSAEREFEKVQESLQYALNDLNSAWNKFSQDLISSGTLTKLVNVLTEVVDLLDKMVNTIGGIPTLFIAVASSIGLVAAALKSIEIPGILLGKGLSVLGLGKASSALTTTAGAGEAVTATTNGATILSLLKNKNKQKQSLDFDELASRYMADPNAIKNFTKAEKAIWDQKKATTALTKEVEASQAVFKKNLATSRRMTTRYGENSDAAKRWADTVRKDYAKMSEAQDKLAEAEFTTNKIRSEAIVEMEAEAASASALTTTLMTLGATLGIVLLAVGLKKLGDAMGLEGAIKDLKKTNSKLKETKDRIQELEDLGENRTDAEDRELGILQKELDVLEQQLERKKELVNLAYSNDAESKFEVEDGKLVTKSGLAGESTQTYTDLIASRKREYAKLQKEFDKALKNGNTAAMESIDSQMTILETTLKTAEDDVRDSYERLANVKYEEQSEIGKALFKDTISAYLQLVDNVDDYRGALEKLPENERVTLNFTDANGNPVSEDFSVGALLGLDKETLNMLINYTFNPEGNSEAFKEFLEQNPDGTAYQLFYDVLFQSEGEDEVEATKDTLTQDKTVDIRYNPITGQLEVVNADIDTTQPVQDVNYNPQTGKLSTLKQSLLQNPLTQYVNIVPRNTKKATGKRKGEQGGLSWLGDEGSAQNPKPELVVGEDGAYLAGTSGWELRALKSSDTVYTAAQTKKLLANNSFQGSVSELPRYAKGKNSINGKKTTAKKAKAKRDKLRESFDKDLETLEYKRGINEWADSTYIDKYQDLVDKYAKSLAKVVVNGNKQGLSTQQKRAFKEALHDANKKKAEKEIEKLADVVKYTGDTSAALAKAKKARDDKLLSAEEYKDYQKDIYKSALEYTQKEYEAGRETWSKLLQDAQNYWAVVDKDSKEYYESLEELRDSAIKTDENRLDYMDDYVSHQIEILQKQKEEEETEERIAELEQDIVDAENELAKARHTMVRTFKDGKWIYDVDQDAIRDAEQAVIDAKKALADEEGTELDKQIAQWEAIQDALDWTKKESEMREAGMVVGEGFIEELKALSMDPAVWADKAQILYNSILAMGQASGTSLEQILSDRAYATGTLSAPGGLSLVGEHGAELAWLGKGDSVYSNRLSSNLMQWGQYTPAQIISAAQGSGGQVFNFANLTLPNVKDANSFIKELQLLPNKAIQHSARR